MHLTRRTTPRRPRSYRRTAGLAVIALTAGLLAVPTVSSSAAPPPNPSDEQLQDAAAQKAALAQDVGNLNAQVAQIRTQIAQKQAEAELAEQKYAYAMQKLQEAKDAAAAAQARAVKAEHTVASAQASFRRYMQSTYMDGAVSGTTGSLLTASDPNVVLEQSALRDYQADHQLDAISQMQTATVAKSNADAAARGAVERQKQASVAADDARQQAEAALEAVQAQSDQLNSELADTQAELVAKQEELATLNHQRAEFIAYQVHQAWLRHQAWLKKQAEIKRAKELAEKQAREEAARRERERQQQEQEQQNNGGGSPSGGSSTSGGGSSHSGDGGTSHPIHPTGGGWSQSKGWDAVNRAKHYLGWMYAWAGGNAYGPTRGVCAGGGAYNDCNVTGFDCSGLTLYGWAPYESLDHYSVTQYSQAGSYHPSSSNLLPGDLVFWSSNGSVSGIHHVAMYIGSGNVIQAPQSGSVITITPLWSVSSGYYGATRPLT